MREKEGLNLMMEPIRKVLRKPAFFDASGLYALSLQQEALNCILFIFSDFDINRPFYFRPVSKVFIIAFPFFNRAMVCEIL